MKLRIHDSTRIALGKKYLDWAEKLPRFGGGVISSLQEIREHQRKQSETAYQNTRPPKGTEVEFLYFRLIEIFHIEEFGKLQDGILELLPALGNRFPPKDFLGDFSAFAGTIWGGGYWKLGFIMREVNRRVAFEAYREMPELPSDVDMIDIELHKILPSIFLLSLDVYLTDEATHNVMRLQTNHCLPTVRFKKLIPQGTLGGGYSMDSAEVVIRQEILSWIDQLRARVEICVRPILSGYFAKRSTGERPLLPAVEVYALRGTPEPEPAFGSWTKESRGWCYSLGFDLHSFDAYKGDNLIFIWGQDSLRKDKTSHRLLVIWEPYVRSLKADGFGSEKKAVTCYTAELLDAMLPAIAVTEFLMLAEKNLKNLRQVTFGSMSHSVFPWYRMRRYLRLQDTLRREVLLLERLSMELEQQRKWIRYDMEQMVGLKTIEPSSGSRPDRNLRDATLEDLEFRRDLLKKHLSLVMSSFSDYLSARNMEIMYRLQRRIFWLTIIITVATIAGVAANWQSVVELLQKVAP